jgi:hypothetical protein
MLTFQGTLVGLGDLLDDLGYAVWSEKGRTFSAFNFANFFGHLSALVEQAQQLPVKAINFYAQRGKTFGLNGLAHACDFSK